MSWYESIFLLFFVVYSTFLLTVAHNSAVQDYLLVSARLFVSFIEFLPLVIVDIFVHQLLTNTGAPGSRRVAIKQGRKIQWEDVGEGWRRQEERKRGAKDDK